MELKTLFTRHAWPCDCQIPRVHFPKDSLIAQKWSIEHATIERFSAFARENDTFSTLSQRRIVSASLSNAPSNAFHAQNAFPFLPSFQFLHSFKFHNHRSPRLNEGIGPNRNRIKAVFMIEFLRAAHLQALEF